MGLITGDWVAAAYKSLDADYTDFTRMSADERRFSEEQSAPGETSKSAAICVISAICVKGFAGYRRIACISSEAPDQAATRALVE